MQSSRATVVVYLCLQIYVGFFAPFISCDGDQFKRGGMMLKNSLMGFLLGFGINAFVHISIYMNFIAISWLQ